MTMRKMMIKKYSVSEKEAGMISDGFDTLKKVDVEEIKRRCGIIEESCDTSIDINDILHELNRQNLLHILYRRDEEN